MTMHRFFWYFTFTFLLLFCYTKVQKKDRSVSIQTYLPLLQVLHQRPDFWQPRKQIVQQRVYIKPKIAKVALPLKIIMYFYLLCWVGGLGARQPVLPQQLGGCRYSNWPSKVVPQSLCNRSFWWRLCVVTLLFGFFCRCWGLCHRTETDLFLFLLK